MKNSGDSQKSGNGSPVNRLITVIFDEQKRERKKEREKVGEVVVLLEVKLHFHGGLKKKKKWGSLKTALLLPHSVV